MFTSLINLIYQLLRSFWLYFLAQVLMTMPFWQSGFTKLFNFDDAVAEMVGDGLTPGAFFAGITIFTQLAATALILFGRRLAWLGAGALGVFTILTIFLVHHFWSYTGAEYEIHLEVFYSHLNIIGGLILSAMAAEFRYGKRRSLAE
ncbi:DoxX family protein [Zophobihabitans entericus]|uniref:DoxX family protein n=1 Tax=Zophobihabitans entericus TaxID=1635327 RepID=A0A6G9IAI5_9GAMM|nr:DoxX family protein [Zophobihabitans entericus]QIQ20734.1 DoxX family protein [Zophobihabitans entericus]